MANVNNRDSFFCSYLSKLANYIVVLLIYIFCGIFQASNYDECFDTPVLPALLEADTFLLLRFSLDDPAQPVVSAAAAAICNLIVNHLDEVSYA